MGHASKTPLVSLLLLVCSSSVMCKESKATEIAATKEVALETKSDSGNSGKDLVALETGYGGYGGHGGHGGHGGYGGHGGHYGGHGHGHSKHGYGHGGYGHGGKHYGGHDSGHYGGHGHHANRGYGGWGDSHHGGHANHGAYGGHGHRHGYLLTSLRVCWSIAMRSRLFEFKYTNFLAQGEVRIIVECRMPHCS
ncbi:uncharacterized protein LOC144173206 [Haemaphysalis longicornis]